MFVLVLAAEADETRQAITFLIVCLVGIAALLGVLTVWYWQFTSPQRRARLLLGHLGHHRVPRPPHPGDAVVGPVADIGPGHVGVVPASIGTARIEVADRSLGLESPTGQRIEVDERHSGHRAAENGLATVRLPPGRPASLAVPGPEPTRSVAAGSEAPVDPGMPAGSGKSGRSSPSEPPTAGPSHPAKAPKVRFHPGGPATDPAGAASVAALIARSVATSPTPPLGSIGSVGAAGATSGSPAGAPDGPASLDADRRPAADNNVAAGQRGQHDEILTDEAWASVMRSAFDKLNR